MYSFTFLGTGGGRFVLLTQRRYSGGIWLDFGSTMILDPGPGALIRALQFGKKPGELDAVLVSHRHLDHYNDAEVMIEAMTYGTKKRRGLLVINKNTLGYISEYHQNAVKVVVPEPEEEFGVGKLKIRALPTFNHEEGIGFKFFTERGTVTYASDTGYSKRLMEYYSDSRILILNVIFPNSKEIKTHLNTENATRIVREIKPELAVIQHFGMSMLNANPDREADFIERKTGVKTIAARDGMTIDLEDLDATRREKQLRISSF
ncbi:MAG: MBL fold metallo-hydrolase [Candidatus Altiarchaeales archaeon]|nr:MAG: MBL fold metallo-hydrolase [Candidatus Altiarchaeales archaeon]